MARVRSKIWQKAYQKSFYNFLRAEQQEKKNKEQESQQQQKNKEK